MIDTLSHSGAVGSIGVIKPEASVHHRIEVGRHAGLVDPTPSLAVCLCRNVLNALPSPGVNVGANNPHRLAGSWQHTEHIAKLGPAQYLL